MLRSLFIKNFIFIETAHIEFKAGLNIFSGETGAGKSMIFLAMTVGLGAKASADFLRSGSEKLEICLTFDNLAPLIQKKISSMGVDGANGLTVKREILCDGKSRCWINEQPFSLAKVKILSPFLVDVHSQHQQQYLLDEAVHVLFYDSFCNLKKEREQYLELYRAWKEKENALQALRQEKKKIAEQKEFLLFTARELEENLIDEATYQNLKIQLTEEGKKSKILENLSKLQNILYKEITPAVEKLQNFAGILDKNFADDAEAAKKESNNDFFAVKIDDLGKIFDELNAYVKQKIDGVGVLQDLDVFHGQLAKVEKLRRKYGMDIVALSQKKKDIDKKILLLDDGNEKEQLFCAEVEQCLQETFAKALVLYKRRKDSLKEFQEKIYQQIRFLGMEQAGLVVSMELRDAPFDVLKDDWHDDFKKNAKQIASMLSVYGIGKISFLYRSSKEREPGQLKKIASGGELSRLMLSLKVILNEKIPVSTMLFDEIDTGIGGEVANCLGQKLQELSIKKQVIVITHLAQIARFADGHFCIFRSEYEEKSVVNTRILKEEEIVKEIARMLGEAKSEIGQKLAMNMIREARKKKKLPTLIKGDK